LVLERIAAAQHLRAVLNKRFRTAMGNLSSFILIEIWRRLGQELMKVNSIVSTYRNLLKTDPDLTMPVAAIESLVQLLAATPSLSTIAESMELLQASIAILKKAIPNAISLSAGTDLFMRYITTAMRGRSSMPGAGGDFQAIRQHLLSNAKVFISRAKEARQLIASTARKFVREGSTVLTYGSSRNVGAVLEAAAQAQTLSGGAPRFRVIYATSTSSAQGYLQDTAAEGHSTIASLRALSVPVAVIPDNAVAYSMSEVSIVMVGAEGVVENGGIVSRLGTYQLSVLAKAMAKPLYVVAESHKFLRMFPLGQFDLGVEQNVLDFTTTDHAAPKAERDQHKFTASTAKGLSNDRTAPERPRSGYFEGVRGIGPRQAQPPESLVHAVDYTPPELITALITETGVLTPSAVSEELIKIWD